MARACTILLLLISSLSSMTVSAGFGHKPPARQLSGYGSIESYIGSTYERFEIGSASTGDKTWYYVPDVLKYGSKAPVVIFLHGFSALYPGVYLSHIEHLLNQGNIVIFPQFQKSTLLGFFSEAGLLKEMDQLIWARRAVASVNQAMEQLVSITEPGETVLMGHSLGGLIALAWQAQGGYPVKSILLSHPQVDSSAGMPDFVKAFVKVKDIPWRDYVGSINVPVVILNGEEDSIAPVNQSEKIYALLESVPTKSFYFAQSDRYGYPRLAPNHGSPLNNISGLPPHLKIFGVSGELDTLDWRFYYAALDAMLDDQVTQLMFDMGAWSNGTAAKPILECPCF